MKRRLRKKLWLGEFQEFIFAVTFKYDQRTNFDVFMNRWDEEVGVRNNLNYGGHGTVGEMNLIVSFRDYPHLPMSVMEERRKRAEDWLRQSKTILEYKVGPLQVDLTHAFKRSKRAAKAQEIINQRIGITTFQWED